MRVRILLSSIFVFILCVFMICVVGCQPEEAKQPKEPEELVIVESGYNVEQSGYVHYGICLENPNEYVESEFPVVTVVGKDASGNILFSDDWTLGQVMPKEKAYYASQAGNGTTPSTVEFSVKTDSSKWKHVMPSDSDIYNISNTNYVPGKFKNDTFTGQITLVKDDSHYKKPMIVVILRDSNGKIVGGYNTYLQKELDADSPTPFSATVYNPAAFASYEIHANPWM